jgi:hypothetical protein
MDAAFVVLMQPWYALISRTSRRKAQMDTVRSVSASLVEVRPDTMYDVAITLRDNKTITLRMYAGWGSAIR